MRSYMAWLHCNVVLAYPLLARESGTEHAVPLFLLNHSSLQHQMHPSINGFSTLEVGKV